MYPSSQVDGVQEMAHAYGNGTGKDVSFFHEAIMEAIANGGQFDDDLNDIFTLRKTPEGSACDYVLDWV